MFFMRREHDLWRRDQVRMTFEDTLAWSIGFVRECDPEFIPNAVAR